MGGIGAKKARSERILKCAYCDTKSSLLHQCTYCGELFCPDHLLPEVHSCPGLVRNWEAYRREREKRIGRPEPMEPIEVYEYERPKRRNIAKYVGGFIVAVVIILALLYLFI